jgi:hypothetical protein
VTGAGGGALAGPGSDAAADPAAWAPDWLSDLPAAGDSLWRGVEAQHRIATMKVVDTVAEQDILEDLLEASKPPLPPQAAGLHFLLATPFRYVSAWPSRFRAAGEPGIWYGARHLTTACAEVGYWRWRFGADSDGLRGRAVVSEHTFFEATVAGRLLDLTAAPWSGLEPSWMHGSDYSACHAVARAAREAGAAWIRYRSVRDPAHGPCGAVMAPQALSAGDLTRQQTWACKVSGGTVLMRPLGVAAEGGPLEFAFG